MAVAAASAATLGVEVAAALTAHPALLAAIDALASSGSTSPQAGGEGICTHPCSFAAEKL